MKQYKLFLDDIRMPNEAYLYTKFKPLNGDNWKIVRNYNQFTDYINRSYKKGFFPSIVAFDHDLALEHYTPEEYWDDYEKSKTYQDEKVYKEKTGMDCAKWLVEFCMNNEIKLPEWYTHSMNSVGKDNIDNYLLNYIKHEKNH